MSNETIRVAVGTIDLECDSGSHTRVHAEHSWMFVVYMACLVDEVPDATPGIVSSTTSSGAACVEPKYQHQKNYLA